MKIDGLTETEHGVVTGTGASRCIEVSRQVLPTVIHSWKHAGAHRSEHELLVGLKRAAVAGHPKVARTARRERLPCGDEASDEVAGKSAIRNCGVHDSDIHWSLLAIQQLLGNSAITSAFVRNTINSRGVCTFNFKRHLQIWHDFNSASCVVESFKSFRASRAAFIISAGATVYQSPV
jgi:hypothetical protein